MKLYKQCSANNSGATYIESATNIIGAALCPALKGIVQRELTGVESGSNR